MGESGESGEPPGDAAVSYHLGVDLGTTYTAAARARSGRAEPVTLGSRSLAVPSVVYLAGDDLLVGDIAVRRAATEPSRVAREFKRRVGDPTPLLLGGTPIAAERLMARLLAWVVRQVAATEGQPPASLAVTHPANWGEFKLDLLRQAVRHVELTVDHLVPEPVAAASFYAAERDLAPGSLVAVYDLGGGTFDAAMVRVDGDGFRIVGRPDGIERLGGIDFDHAVFGHVLGALSIEPDQLDPADPAVTTALTQLRHDCVEAKEALSTDTDVSIPVLLPNRHTEVRLTRAELEAMIRPAIGETLVALRRAIGSATPDLDEVSAVLLVGGSSRIPLIAELLSTDLGRPVAVDARPKEAISLGAALLADRAATEHTGFVGPVPAPIAAVAPATGAPGPATVGASGPPSGPPLGPPTTAVPGPPEGGPRPPAEIVGSTEPVGPGSPDSRSRWLWLAAGAAVLVASLAASTQIDTLRAEDAATKTTDRDQQTSSTTTGGRSSTTTTDDPDDTTTTSGTAGTGEGAADPLPAWGAEARTQFVDACLNTDAMSTLADMITSLGLGDVSPEDACECMYDDISESGVDIGTFNEAWTAEDIYDLPPTHPGRQRMEQAANTCAAQLALEDGAGIGG